MSQSQFSDDIKIFEHLRKDNRFFEFDRIQHIWVGTRCTDVARDAQFQKIRNFDNTMAFGTFINGSI